MKILRAAAIVVAFCLYCGESAPAADELDPAALMHTVEQLSTQVGGIVAFNGAPLLWERTVDGEELRSGVFPTYERLLDVRFRTDLDQKFLAEFEVTLKPEPGVRKPWGEFLRLTLAQRGCEYAVLPNGEIYVFKSKKP